MSDKKGATIHSYKLFKLLAEICNVAILLFLGLRSRRFVKFVGEKCVLCILQHQLFHIWARPYTITYLNLSECCAYFAAILESGNMRLNLSESPSTDQTRSDKFGQTYLAQLWSFFHVVSVYLSHSFEFVWFDHMLCSKL